MSSTRTRAVSFPERNAFLRKKSYSIPWDIWSYGPDISGSFRPSALIGRQTTVSEYHPGWRNLRGARSDVGGNFYTSKSSVISEMVDQATGGSKLIQNGQVMTHWNYQGPVLPWNCVDAVFPPAVNSDVNTLNAAGAEAIAQCKPTNSVADLSTALGELFREGLPALAGAQFWKDRTHLARSAGGEYLNVQFGWLPLVNDVTKVAVAISQADAIIRQYQRDAGKVVRRRWNFPTSTEYERTLFRDNTSGYFPVSTSEMFNPNQLNMGKVWRTRKTERRRWFSGAFTYHLPDYFGELSKRVAEAKKVLGIGLDPETLWNLAPWTWAVDWFSNAGDVISNLTDFASDGLVMHHGYIMETSSVTDTYDFEGLTGFSDQSLRPLPLILNTTIKTRRRANPFGFGLTFDALTDRQQAIIVALGFSRT